MKKKLKWFLIIAFSLIGIVITGYGAYKIYNYLVDDATKRIKQGVSEGVSEGAGEAMNPFGLVGKIFGGGKS